MFLGAGASAFAKMPTTEGLIHEIQDRVAQREIWENAVVKHLVSNIVEEYNDKDVEELYQAIREMKDAEKLHKRVVEHKAKDHGGGKKRVIQTTSRSHSDNATTISEAEDVDENIRALESLEKAIRNTLLTSFTVKTENVDKVVSTYDKLFELVPRNIVTTNYDNVLETYCEQKKLDLVNGFKRSHLGYRRIWEGERDSAWDVGEDALRLVKLHGSTTWQENDNGDVSDIYDRGLHDGGDVMVYPTLGEKDYSHGIFPELWKRFEAILTKTELLIVVGFSFRDPQINQILQSRLKRTAENPMKLLYIDPRHEVLKALVGADVEWRPARTERGTLGHYYQDEMPYVYAYNVEFPPRPHKLELVLEILDKVSSSAT